MRRARLVEASPAPPSRDADGNGRRASGETRGRRRSLDSVMRSTNAPGGNNARVCARRGQRRGVARTFLVASAYSPYIKPNMLARVSVDSVGSRHVGGLPRLGLCHRPTRSL